MELETLWEFAEVARLESFSRAAETLHLSQSSLSKHIIALEKELGFRLLDRTSRRVALTAEGARLLPYAQQGTQLLLQLQRLGAELHAAQTGEVRVAAIPVMSLYGIPEALAAFRREFPASALQILECESRDIPAMLSEGQCQLAFVRDPETLGDYETLELGRDVLVAALALSHPLAGRTQVSLAELQHEDFLLLDAGSSLYSQCLALCRAAGFAPNIRYTGSRPSNLLALAASGLGTALVMKSHVRLGTAQVAAVPIVPEVPSRICLVRSRSQTPTQCAQRFWRFMEAWAVQQEGVAHHDGA